VAQKWTAVAAPRRGPVLTCINDGIHGSDFEGGELRLSLLRSPAYAADPAAGRPIPCQDRFIPRIDQGEHVFRFWFNAGPARDRLDRVEGEALVKNEAPYILAYFPPGREKRARPFLALSDPVIQVTAVKKAEDGGALVLRLFEPTGRRRSAVLSLPFAGARTKISLAPFEIRTLAWNPRSKKFRRVDLLERPEGGR
jgi:alpha-mannosidase